MSYKEVKIPEKYSKQINTCLKALADNILDASGEMLEELDVPLAQHEALILNMTLRAVSSFIDGVLDALNGVKRRLAELEGGLEA